MWFSRRKTSSALSYPLDVRDYVTLLQRDGRLLLRHMARRTDSGSALPEGAPAGLTHDGTPSNVLFANPETVAANKSSIAELVSSVDLLSRRAFPANVRSIRLTQTYLGMFAESGEPPIEIKKEASRVKNRLRFVMFSAVILLVSSVLLLSHVDYGRRLLLQLAELRSKEQALTASMIEVPAKDTVIRGPVGARDGGTPLCRPRRDGGAYLEPKTRKADDLCRQDTDLRLRLALTYVAFADWNCLTSRVLNLAWRNDPTVCGRPKDPPADIAVKNVDAKKVDPKSGDSKGVNPNDEVSKAWESHEIRTSNLIGVVGGFVLPVMLGGLGGCAYVLRRLDEKLRTWTLEPNDGWRALVRVGLATLLGGLVGVVWSSDERLNVGGITLSLAAVAFLIGFSVEAVFKLLESFTNSVIAGLQGSASTMPPVTFQAAPRLSLPLGPPDKDASPDLPPKVPGPSTGQASLVQIGKQLMDQRKSLAALAKLDAGTPVILDAPALIGPIDQTLKIIEPLLSGSPDAAGVTAAVTQAASALEVAKNAGLPGILADYAATLKGVADFAKPVLMGIPGGPIGIIGGIILGGLKLYDNQQQFQAFEAAILKKPFDPTLRPRVADAPTALAALQASPLMSARVADATDPAFAMQLMQVLLATNGDGAPIPASELAPQLMRPDHALKLGTRFETLAELAMTIDEYRGAAIFAEAFKRLQGSVDLPRIADTPATPLDLRQLATAVLDLHADPRASAAIEGVFGVAEALAKSPSGPQGAIDLVTSALGEVSGIVARARQTGEVR